MALNSLPSLWFRILPQITFEIIGERGPAGERDWKGFKNEPGSTTPILSCDELMFQGTGCYRPFQGPQFWHWICSDNALAGNPHQIPTLQWSLLKAQKQARTDAGLFHTEPLGSRKENAGQLLATGQTSVGVRSYFGNRRRTNSKD